MIDRFFLGPNDGVDGGFSVYFSFWNCYVLISVGFVLMNCHRTSLHHRWVLLGLVDSLRFVNYYYFDGWTGYNYLILVNL